MDNTTLTIDPRTTVRFDKRQHGPTVWLTVNTPAGTDLAALDECLAGAGWNRRQDPSPTPARCPRSAGEPDYNATEIVYLAPGSGLFGAHTTTEATQLKSAARTALARFGFTHIPTNTLTLQNMF